MLLARCSAVPQLLNVVRSYPTTAGFVSAATGCSRSNGMTVSANSSASFGFFSRKTALRLGPLSTASRIGSSGCPQLREPLVPEHAAQAIFAGFPEQLRHIARKIALAFIEIEEERHVWPETALRVEEDKAGQ